MNSAEIPPAVAPAVGHTNHADGADRARAADLTRTAARPQDLAAPAGPPGSVTGPVAPTTAAVGSHQPLARARLTAGLLHQWQQRNLAASLPLALRQLEDAGNLDNVRLAIQADRAAQRRTAGAEGDSTIALTFPPASAASSSLLIPGVTAIAIPYFQWDNCDGGPMRVWMPRG